MPLFTGPFCCLLQVTTAFWCLRSTVTASLLALGLICLVCLTLVFSLWLHVGAWASASEMCNWNVELCLWDSLRADVWLGECPEFCCWWWRGQNHCEQYVSKPILAVNVSVVFISFFFLFCSQVMCIFRCISWEEMTLQWKPASAFLWSSGFDWISPLRVDRYACYWITGSRLRSVSFDYASDKLLNSWGWEKYCGLYMQKNEKSKTRSCEGLFRPSSFGNSTLIDWVGLSAPSASFVMTPSCVV